ncbi:urease subunit gamma [Aquihabitans sp. McL0605]|uniref:urease subunit gamma n=1 Tax=Aquihabitans sp. McL0605 TaxID=3415671 RepID=UPI003CECA5B2
MHLSPHEQERLLVHVAADVARSRRERGHRLNHPEAVAVLTAWVFEAARDGRSVADTMAAGREVLDADDVMDGVGHLIEELQVEATFPDGTKLVTLHDPIQAGAGTGGGSVVPGEVLVAGEPITLFEGRPLTPLAVVNDGDRPVQVGSHFHFAEANEALRFDRTTATGRRLAVPAGTSVRFEPGIPMDVLLVDLAGEQIAAGFRGLHGGAVTPGGAS